MSISTTSQLNAFKSYNVDFNATKTLWNKQSSVQNRFLASTQKVAFKAAALFLAIAEAFKNAVLSIANGVINIANRLNNILVNKRFDKAFSEIADATDAMKLPSLPLLEGAALEMGVATEALERSATVEMDEEFFTLASATKAISRAPKDEFSRMAASTDAMDMPTITLTDVSVETPKAQPNIVSRAFEAVRGVFNAYMALRG